MSSDPHPSPQGRLWHGAKEYLTHWFIAGVIVTLTGFTPDHWVAHVFHAVNLDSLRGMFIQYQFLAVYIGVTFLIVDGVVRYRTRQLQPAVAPAMPDAPAIQTEAADTAAEAIEDRLSIAVLPFVNLSSDPEKEYLADGMTEDIITGLSYDSRLFVIARNSTFAYKGQAVDVRAAGRELGVRYVLEGSIRPMGERLRVTVQLIETASGAHIWADRIDRRETEIFDVMDDLVDGVVMALCANLGIAEAARAARQRPENLQAWALCVQAGTSTNIQLNLETGLAAKELARRAVEIEPGYGPAWAMLARLTALSAWSGNTQDPSADRELALSFARKALSLAPGDAAVLGDCGLAFTYAGDYAPALDCLERSLRINPNDSQCRTFYGFALACDGRAGAGIAQLDQILRLSPRNAFAGMIYFFHTRCYLMLGDFVQAERFVLRMMKEAPNSFYPYLFYAASLTHQGRVEEAKQQIRKMRQLEPQMTRERLEEYIRRFPGGPDVDLKAVSTVLSIWPD